MILKDIGMIGILLISVLVLGCVGEKVSSNTSDVKATPQIIPNSTTPQVTLQATPKATYTPISTPTATPMPTPTPAPTSTLTPGVLITGTGYEEFNIGSGYSLILEIIEPSSGLVAFSLKKDGIGIDGIKTLSVDKPVIFGNVISVTVKSIKGTQTRAETQFTYNFI